MRKLIKALILAAIIQVALDAQDVFKGGGGEAARAVEIRTVEQESARIGRGVDFCWGLERSPWLRPGLCLRH